MTITEAWSVAAGIVVVLSLVALAQERDHRDRMDDTCWRLYQKQYSPTLRACVRPQR